ncbi:MAG TPA: YceI family protein [Acidimicrobiales bacterium]|nr:YceI family protein [Acidimicrobiales bacterium]
MSKRTKILLGVGLALVVVVGGGAYWYLKDDAAPRANLDAAAARANDDTTDSTADAAPEPLEGITGEWTVGSGSFAGYRIDEVLTVGSNTATSRTDQVTGSLSVEDVTITEVTITVAMDSLSSTDGNGIRDGRVRDVLDTANNPDATFVLTDPIVLDGVPAAGESVDATATGELTLKGITKTVEVSVQAQVEGTKLLVVGNAPVVLADHGIDKPSAGRVVSIEDAGELEFELIFEPA